MIIKGVVINDLHFGIKDSKRLYDELQLFKDYISSHELNLLVFDGDFWDCKLSAGDPAVFYGLTFFSEVMKICKEKNIIVRMVQGTRSHDLNQLQLFKPNENTKDYNFRIIETACEEDLLGLHLLWLPEEYPENNKEFYAPYLAEGKEYNIIFGHGTWLFQAQPGVYEKSLVETHSAPVFVEEEWIPHIPNGFVSFGHIHSRHIWPVTKEIKDTTKIFYSGAYTRWNFGERSERGFTYFEYDLSKLTYHVEFVDNTLAPKYDVMAVSDLGVDLEKTDIVTIQEMLNEAVSKTDNLRIDLAGLSTEKIDILKKHFADNENVKIEVRENKTLLKESVKADPTKFEKYHYITRREVPLNEMVKRYCKEEMDVDLDIKTIDDALAEEA